MTVVLLEGDQKRDISIAAGLNKFTDIFNWLDLIRTRRVLTAVLVCGSKAECYIVEVEIAYR